MGLNRFWQMLVLISFLIIIDQWTKGIVQSGFYLGESIDVIKGFFNITYVHNQGAAWSMGAGADDWVRHLMFRYLPVVICIGLVYLQIKSLKSPYYVTVGYSLILAGACGNLFDRFTLDYVVDFLHVYYGSWHFPVFNVADSCVTIGGALLVLDYLCELRNKNATRSTSN
jgi:signal peptidase II